MQRADRTDCVTLVVSNPCFEAWLVFHFETYGSPLEDKTRATARVRKHIKTYDPNNLRFEDFSQHVGHAVAWSKKSPDAPLVDPSSTMWKLVEALDRLLGENERTLSNSE
jgi:hypothetical protein